MPNQSNESRPFHKDLESILYAHVPLPMFTMDEEGALLNMNEGAMETLRVDWEQNQRSSVFQLFESECRESLYLALATVNKISQVEKVELIKRNGETFETFCLSLQLLPDKQVIAFIAPLIDKGMDPLTGVPIRQEVPRLMERTFQENQAETYVLFLINLDRFKLVNDSLGEGYGDQVLQTLVRRLLWQLPNQQWIARVSGDEFIACAAIKGELPKKETLATYISSIIQQPFQVDEVQFTMTASIGAAVYPMDGKSVEMIWNSLERALRHAKARGGNCVSWFCQELKDEWIHPFRLENDLRRAVENQELELYFQPIFETTTGEHCGEEVLVRWNHPALGVLGPNFFIPVAEEIGLIGVVGKWVLDEACKQKALLIEKEASSVPMSVNLSLRQFLQPDIVDMILDSLNKYGLDPSLLEVEVTERITIDMNRAMKVLQKLRAQGIRVSLDDFGTGYSSLQYISQLPIQKLKIDKSFIAEIGVNSQVEAIISMIIHLGHELDLTVVAEGVETEKQLSFLKEKKCDTVQGYYHAKPLTFSEFKKYLLS
ncbi:EAL domain-containing protein [Halalkalibacterium halodurans]|uniref:BH2971 protein n=1 Tax=Halalkalibacterium halodurans (strain ATCC BAA-125 / DSM 18197 / FERM 7344 / JCM 9153 / C-125) TaxID=272558 RepID=Q9K8N4_HALH5|nr:EAL domain-containing protein [Halalkalibacterium halodurans]MED4082790.1 EAL domain-containing protein [Halalkalibacterium halodurans]MED4085949.1 EAL domain-containing protein [Halalkalibacterium halodurans]MED4103167.1 EAL domain-containing protein [Halalkalibacterium halodurans]MED4109503.1 EAL domain-containing protein [Halalkalibacterium halodurans]MED4123122.1 EAL domain-containing protein [Halalkalibacterium halodurans]